MSAIDYKLSRQELHAIAANRLADIDACIAEGDTTQDWTAERAAQLRLLAQVAA